ncbi:DUF421 domain-containing protein [Niallia taxi]|uniref:DUF421 domain-containing protein n=1 Tax=Pedobacter suwonensis TaxID=332999 RepID=UPI0021753D42|nr:DUF421 domain-containing protein [Niallia taxi]MDK8643941.1 DUF421 domain-containing protein [Niallia taxi]MED4057583.1 DUF421 domain-containing protein [Niallia taxi]
MTGKSKIVIENGQIDYQILKKLRMTVDQLEMRIRTKGISNISDIQIATIEPNGQLGYELKKEAKPLTYGEFTKLIGGINGNQNENSNQDNNEYKEPNIFQEIKNTNTQKHNKIFK